MVSQLVLEEFRKPGVCPRIAKKQLAHYRVALGRLHGFRVFAVQPGRALQQREHQGRRRVSRTELHRGRERVWRTQDCKCLAKRVRLAPAERATRVRLALVQR